MEIIFSDKAKARIERDLMPGKVLVLDFDDGVGPFSDAATCTLDVSFNLLIVDPAELTKDFDTTITSNLGDVYVKEYAKNQMDAHMRMDLDKYLRFQLTSDSGMLDPNITLLVH